jgi:hypothetical protein
MKPTRKNTIQMNENLKLNKRNIDTVIMNVTVTAIRLFNGQGSAI